MMVSTKGRYALRVMLDLAQQDAAQYIVLTDIAARQEISEKYLESILATLSKAGFVRALRGRGGGYQLARSPESYSVGSILKLTEGSLAPVACLNADSNACTRADTCLTLPMWQRAHAMIDDFFEGISLQDLLDEQKDSTSYII